MVVITSVSYIAGNLKFRVGCYDVVFVVIVFHCMYMHRFFPKLLNDTSSLAYFSSSFYSIDMKVILFFYDQLADGF